MSDPSNEGPERDSRERRDLDRRGGDRRSPERRAPAPIWRRSWAYIGYGVIGAFLIVVLSRMIDDEEPSLKADEIVTASAAPAVDTSQSAAATAPPREAMDVGGYETLLAEGERAVGQRVVTRLFCESVSSVSLRTDVVLNESIAAVADPSGLVPAAECKWGGGTDAPDILLLVPPVLAAPFAAAPEVQQGFLRRRDVRAEVEWIGRSDALSLRNVAVLRGIQ